MATDGYLKLTNVTGESKDKDHTGEIEIKTWSWGGSNAGYFGTGTGGSKGKGTCQDITVVKDMDKSSPELFKKMLTGGHFDEGVLTSYKASGDGSRVKYLEVQLKKVYISSYLTGSSGDSVPTEHVSLNFEEFKYVYTPQKDDGTADAKVEFAYNLAEHDMK